MEKREYKTIRITAEAHAALRQLYADTGETLTELASRLIVAKAADQPKVRR